MCGVQGVFQGTPAKAKICNHPAVGTSRVLEVSWWKRWQSLKFAAFFPVWTQKTSSFKGINWFEMVNDLVFISHDLELSNKNNPKTTIFKWMFRVPCLYTDAQAIPVSGVEDIQRKIDKNSINYFILMECGGTLFAKMLAMILYKHTCVHRQVSCPDVTTAAACTGMCDIIVDKGKRLPRVYRVTSWGFETNPSGENVNTLILIWPFVLTSLS